MLSRKFKVSASQVRPDSTVLTKRRKAFVISVICAAVLLISNAAPAKGPVFDPERGVMTMAPLLERATPAVVNVSVRARVPGRDNPLLRDPFFRRFFDLPERSPDQKVMSAGSGVIVDSAKGHVLTNHHVVDNAERITVTLKDRRTLIAKLIGSDPETDVALLRIEAKALKAIPLGDSDHLKVGDVVFAIGNPFGLGQTVTSGIVSALGRGIGMTGYEDFIQTDASINPGNSGGALVNSKGELIGINTAIIGPSGGNVGIGFAVPSNMARAVMDQLIRFGEVRRGRLGVVVQDMTPDLASAFGIGHKTGAVVTKVEPKSPADRAGLRPGDIIAAVDGRSIRNSSDLRNKIGLVPAGKTVTLKYFRDRAERTASVEVGSVQTPTVKGEQTIPQLTGAVFRDMTQAEISAARAKGVIVARVARDSPAWRYGIREGDIVRQVNRRPVATVRDFVRTMKTTSGAFWLDVLRGGRPFLVVIG